MIKKLEYPNYQLDELKQVIKLCSREVGVTKGEMVYIITTYFRKHGSAEIMYSKVYDGTTLVDSEKSTIIPREGGERITVKEVVDDLINKGVMYYNSVQAEDIVGNKLWLDEEKTIERRIKFLKLSEVCLN